MCVCVCVCVCVSQYIYIYIYIYEYGVSVHTYVCMYVYVAYIRWSFNKCEIYKIICNVNGEACFCQKYLQWQETWICHNTSELKRQSMEWKYSDFLVKKKLQQSVKKAKLKIWNIKGLILIDVFEWHATVNSASYCQLLRQNSPNLLNNFHIYKMVWLVVWVLWHINPCRLFNAKSIFKQITSSLSNNSVQFNSQECFYFKPFSIFSDMKDDIQRYEMWVHHT